MFGWFKKKPTLPAEPVLQKEPTHGLTDRLLVWRKGQWEEFRG